MNAEVCLSVYYGTDKTEAGPQGVGVGHVYTHPLVFRPAPYRTLRWFIHNMDTHKRITPQKISVFQK